VKCRVGREEHWSLIDTGSDRVVIGHRLGEKFETLRHREMKGLAGRVSVREVRLPPVRFLGKTYRCLPAIVRPPSSSRLDVILGANVVLDRRLTLDVDSRVVRVGARADAPAAEDRRPLRFRGGRPYLRATFGGRPVFALLDTGAPLCEVNERISGLRAEVLRVEAMTDGSGAPRDRRVYRGPKLRWGHWELGTPEFWRSPLDAVALRSGARVDFVLGAHALLAARGSWTIDRREGWIGRTHGAAGRPGYVRYPGSDGGRGSAGVGGANPASSMCFQR
jgi:hypothetical protein